MKTQKKQAGFALVEVMIAALVMVAGGVAFMRLQQMGLQYNYNNYSRTQGLSVAQGFTEQLRGNVVYLRTQKNLISGKIDTSQASPGAIVDCDMDVAKKTCGESVFAWAKYLTSKKMKEISSTSTLCYRESAADSGSFRITYLWKDNSALGKEAPLECPVAFDAALKDKTGKKKHANSVTIYVQI